MYICWMLLSYAKVHIFFFQQVLWYSALICDCDGTNGPSSVTEVVTRISATAIEIEEISAIGVVGVLRPRPVVAAGPTVAGVGAFAVPSRGKEDTPAILPAGELATLDAIHGGPGVRAVVYQLITLYFRRHTPVTAPLHMGDVVSSTADAVAEILTLIILIIPAIPIRVLTRGILVRNIIVC